MYVCMYLLKRCRGRIICTNNFKTIIDMLNKAVFGNWTVIQFEVMSIYNQGSMCLIDCDESNNPVTKHCVNFIWSHPSRVEFSFEIFEPRVIEKCPISSLKHIFLDKFIMPFSSLLLNYSSVMGSYQTNLIQLI